MKACAASLAVAITTGLLAACLSSPSHERVVTLGLGLTVTLPHGSPDVTARRGCKASARTGQALLKEAHDERDQGKPADVPEAAGQAQ